MELKASPDAISYGEQKTPSSPSGLVGNVGKRTHSDLWGL